MTATIEKLLKQLETTGFWGELTLKFQHGEVVHAKKVESVNLPKQPKDRAERGKDERVSTN